jgi:hypothetical protein
VAAFALGRGAGRPVPTPGEAVAVWRSTGLARLELGEPGRALAAEAA